MICAYPEFLIPVEHQIDGAVYCLSFGTFDSMYGHTTEVNKIDIVGIGCNQHVIIIVGNDFCNVIGLDERCCNPFDYIVVTVYYK